MMIEEIPCDGGCKDGDVVNYFTQEITECATCSGTGKLYPCEQFTVIGPSAFRNRRCHYCGVREDKHVAVERLRESV